MSHSRLNEEEVIGRLISKHPDIVHHCVDIGASTGPIWSNVWGLIQKGWGGLLVECNPEKTPQLKEEARGFLDVKVETEKCTPINVCRMLAKHGVPNQFGVLSLDIDGYDYHVLRALLRTHRPDIICCELNPCIPPPYKFSVNFDPNYWWGSNPFFGMSLSAVAELLSPYNYRLIEVIEDNAIFSFYGERKNIHEAWEQGAMSGADNWGKQQARHISSLLPGDAIDYIYNGMWGGCIGKFEVWI